MPERPQRFFWVYGSRIGDEDLPRLNELHIHFVDEWARVHHAILDCTSCVVRGGDVHSVWLFRLGLANNEPRIVSEFSGALANHLQHLKQNHGADVRRRSNQPTPLIAPRLVNGNMKIDIGLHSVNDPYNQMLVTFPYYELSRKQMPLHFQLSSLRSTLTDVEQLWRAAACDCRIGACESCHGEGCYSCFSLDCPRCAGTGWERYADWVNAGFRVDYTEGVPIAAL